VAVDKRTADQFAADFDEAERAYERIRSSRNDVAAIAAHTACSVENIRKVKEHLLLKKHLLDRYAPLGEPGSWSRFDADLRIAEAWRRLEKGVHKPADMRLLYHEIAEAWYMRRHGPGYAAAHAAAARRFPSPLE